MTTLHSTNCTSVLFPTGPFCTVIAQKEKRPVLVESTTYINNAIVERLVPGHLQFVVLSIMINRVKQCSFTVSIAVPAIHDINSCRSRHTQTRFHPRKKEPPDSFQFHRQDHSSRINKRSSINMARTAPAATICAILATTVAAYIFSSYISR
jgi:hypothetical protein